MQCTTLNHKWVKLSHIINCWQDTESSYFFLLESCFICCVKLKSIDIGEINDTKCAFFSSQRSSIWNLSEQLIQLLSLVIESLLRFPRTLILIIESTDNLPQVVTWLQKCHEAMDLQRFCQAKQRKKFKKT